MKEGGKASTKDSFKQILKYSELLLINDDDFMAKRRHLFRVLNGEFEEQKRVFERLVGTTTAKNASVGASFDDPSQVDQSLRSPTNNHTVARGFKSVEIRLSPGSKGLGNKLN